jgi:hypothetical protein
MWQLYQARKNTLQKSPKGIIMNGQVFIRPQENGMKGHCDSTLFRARISDLELNENKAQHLAPEQDGDHHSLSALYNRLGRVLH